MTKARVRSRNSPTRRGLRQSLRLGALLLAGVATGPLAAGRADADDTVMIHVRGRSQLRLYEGERRTTDGEHFQLVVHVRLDDGQQGVGAGTAGGAADSLPDEPAANPASDPARSFAGQRVQLRLSGPDGELAPHTVTTGPDGRAVLPLSELTTGRYTVVAEYAGDELRDSAHADLTVDLGRLAVSLTLAAPSQVARLGQLPLEVRLQSEGQGLTAEVQLRVGNLVRPVQIVRGFGQAVLPLRSQAGLRKGQALAVLASYPGDRFHTSALQRRDVLLTSQAQVSLELVTPPLRRPAVPESSRSPRAAPSPQLA